MSRHAAFACLALLTVASPGFAQRPTPTSASEPLLDGITVRALGWGGALTKHTLTVSMPRPNFDNAELERQFEARRSAIIAALEAKGLKQSPAALSTGGFGGGGTGGGGFGRANPFGPISFSLPDGLCDGATLAGHPRKEIVEAAVAAGAAPQMTLVSTVDPTRETEDRRAATAAAMRQGRESAENLARVGGVKLGKLIAVRQESSYIQTGVR